MTSSGNIPFQRSTLRRWSSLNSNRLLVKLLRPKTRYWVSAARSPALLAGSTTCQVNPLTVKAVHFGVFSSSTLTTINTANVPGFGLLIDGIQRKKFRESLVIAVVVALLICIAIWCVPSNQANLLFSSSSSNHSLSLSYQVGVSPLAASSRQPLF